MCARLLYPSHIPNPAPGTPLRQLIRSVRQLIRSTPSSAPHDLPLLCYTSDVVGRLFASSHWSQASELDPHRKDYIQKVVGRELLFQLLPVWWRQCIEMGISRS